MLVSASTPISAGVTHACGTYSSPPPTGTGAVGTSTALTVVWQAPPPPDNSPLDELQKRYPTADKPAGNR